MNKYAAKIILIIEEILDTSLNIFVLKYVELIILVHFGNSLH